ncbi:MAG: LytTR family DNA-binding domain-containing protein, partial [Oscillospiraceae bacterium]
METLKIAICEDTHSEEEKLLALLNKSDIPTSCTVFTSGEALLKTYEPQAFDLLLMDIYMGGITGVETVSKIREIDEDVPVAFITTSTDHALESYRLSALKYIEKPFKQKDIEEILTLAQLKKSNVPSLVIKKNGIEEKIPFSQILYLEQQTHQVNIYLK